MIVYKSAGKNNEYLITLELNPDKQNNLKRPSVVDPNYAKFRCDSARVVSITNKETGKLVDRAPSNWNPEFIYETGAFVYSEYDTNINAVCGKGIHFYLTEKAAFANGYQPSTGPVEIWHDNGIIRLQAQKIDGKLEGPYNRWGCNGLKWVEANYKNNQPEGIWKYYNSNGDLVQECSYKDGLLHGICKFWDSDGNLTCQQQYEEGQLIQ